ncbi:MAG: CapA family protein [Anaerolineae bacterium]|nr:CapA family protein [Anaerolineae bacterium]
MPTIAMVGDIFPQQTLPASAELAAVRKLLRSADIAFGNLETPVSRRGRPTEKWINMRMPPELLADVRDLGFDMLTLANNHMLDFGELAFRDTLDHLREHDLPFVGAGLDLDAAWRAQVLRSLSGRRIDPWSGLSCCSGQARRGADSCVGSLPS